MREGGGEERSAHEGGGEERSAHEGGGRGGKVCS